MISYEKNYDILNKIIKVILKHCEGIYSFRLNRAKIVYWCSTRPDNDVVVVAGCSRRCAWHYHMQQYDQTVIAVNSITIILQNRKIFGHFIIPILVK